MSSSLMKFASVTLIWSLERWSKYSAGSEMILTLVMLGRCANFPVRNGRFIKYTRLLNFVRNHVDLPQKEFNMSLANALRPGFLTICLGSS